jgi:hypothetical protein
LGNFQLIPVELLPDAIDSGVSPVVVDVATRVGDQLHAVKTQGADNVDGFFRMSAWSEAREVST